MKECDILGGQNILGSLLHIFRGSRLPQPPRSEDLRPCSTLQGFALLLLTSAAI